MKPALTALTLVPMLALAVGCTAPEPVAEPEPAQRAQSLLPESGTRRTVVMFVTWPGFPTWANPQPYHLDRLYGASGSVRHWGFDISDGKLLWTYAGHVGPLTDPRLGDPGVDVYSVYLEMFAASGFAYENFDDNADGTVDSKELTLIVVTSLPGPGGQTSMVCGTPPGRTTSLCSFAATFGQQAPYNTMAHELMHTLGGGPGHRTVDDLYTGWISPQPTSGRLSVMSNQNLGDKWLLLDPWHRIGLGWIPPRVTTFEFGDLTERTWILEPHQYPDYFPTQQPVVLRHTASSDYFILEYRKQTAFPFSAAFDEGIPRSGLVVWHIRENGPNLEVTRLPGFTEDSCFGQAYGGLDGTPGADTMFPPDKPFDLHTQTGGFGMSLEWTYTGTDQIRVTMRPIDTDQDGRVDFDDNCLTVANANWQDSDVDGDGDACAGMWPQLGGNLQPASPTDPAGTSYAVAADTTVVHAPGLGLEAFAIFADGSLRMKRQIQRTQWSDWMHLADGPVSFVHAVPTKYGVDVLTRENGNIYTRVRNRFGFDGSKTLLSGGGGAGRFTAAQLNTSGLYVVAAIRNGDGAVIWGFVNGDDQRTRTAQNFVMTVPGRQAAEVSLTVIWGLSARLLVRMTDGSVWYTPLKNGGSTLVQIDQGWQYQKVVAARTATASPDSERPVLFGLSNNRVYWSIRQLSGQWSVPQEIPLQNQYSIDFTVAQNAQSVPGDGRLEVLAVDPFGTVRGSAQWTLADQSWGFWGFLAQLEPGRGQLTSVSNLVDGRIEVFASKQAGGTATLSHDWQNYYPWGIGWQE